MAFSCPLLMIPSSGTHNLLIPEFNILLLTSKWGFVKWDKGIKFVGVMSWNNKIDLLWKLARIHTLCGVC